MTEKNYNSNREKLRLPEYGRNILEMVNLLLEVEDREERNRMARAVIEVMGNINPQLRDSTEYRHKLWDHLFILSDFRLDIDSPYGVLKKEQLDIKPERLPYPKNDFSHKQYGNNVRDVIRLLKEEGNEEQKREVACDLAKFMKVKSYEYNQEYPSNEVIVNDIRKFSDGEIVLDENMLNGTKLQYNKPGGKSNQKNGAKTGGRRVQPQRKNNGTNGTGNRKNNFRRSNNG